MEATTIPAPRTGLAGYWDRLVGPGMSRGELMLVIAASVAGAIWAAMRLSETGHSWLLVAVGAAIGFDTVGGAVCNATPTTKRWYFRPGQRWTHHVVFVLPHLLYVAAAWWLFGMGLDAVTLLAASIVIGTAAIIAAPGRTKRAVAFFAFLIALLPLLALARSVDGLEWLAPALLLKLLVGHLVPPGRA